MIKSCYTENGFEKCQKLTGLSKERIQYILQKHGIKRKPAFNPDMFIKALTKESSYVLGFLWADGHISTKTKNSEVLMEIVDEDLREIKRCMESTGAWRFHTRKRGDNKPITRAVAHSRELYEFLERHDYGEKSTKSADKILSHIPEEFHRYFFRGLIDGDGCFYINEKQYLYQFSLASSFDQDWSYFTKFLDKIGVEYKIQKNSKLNKKGVLNQSSAVRATNKKYIAKLFECVYEGYDSDKIGLPRKYEKALFIKEKSKITRKDIVMKNMKPLSANGKVFSTAGQAAKILEIKKDAVVYRLHSKSAKWKTWHFIES